MKALIVDDELQGRETMEYFLQEFHPEIDIVGLCENIQQAGEVIRSDRPDLLFLDVNMPEGTGFELFDQVNLDSVMVVFVTAHEEHALKAFQVNAFDYLTKPLKRDNLKRVVEKAEKALSGNGNGNNKKINIKVSTSNHLLAPSDVVCLESDGNYTTVVLENGERLLISKAIKKLQESHFHDFPFLRVHQSFIINLNHVSEYDNSGLTLSNGQKVSVSRSNYDAFLEAISKL